MAEPTRHFFNSDRLTKLAALLFVAGILIADLFTPPIVLMALLYAIPVGLGLFGGWSLSFLWAMTALSCLLSLLPCFLPESDTAAGGFNLVNRILTCGLLVFLAGLVHLWVASRSRLEIQREALKRNNAELGERDEEIVWQNHALEHREKMLEQLLKLSRSITPDLARDDLLKKICESLAVITSNPVAVLERRGEEMVVACSAGFGPGGPLPGSIPFPMSFAAFLDSTGQTAVVEDLRLRPDLVIPRLPNGEGFRSVLASPLKVHGRFIGTIEVYSFKPQTFDEGQFAMIESLAAQASFSLQDLEMVEKIREERLRFEVAFRTLPFGIAIAEDPRGARVRLNPAGCALLNVAAGEDISVSAKARDRLLKNFSRGGLAVREEDLPMSRALRGEEVVGEELELALPHRPSMVFLTSASPFRDAKGAIAGAIIGFADITEQKKLHRELDLRRREAEEASLRKTRFLAAVSHDIRTPANAIQLLAEVIRRTHANPAMAAGMPDLIEKLQTNVKSLTDLVSDLLDVARFDTGHVGLEETEFSLDELIASECRIFEPLAAQKGLSLTFQPETPGIRLRTDRVKLARVVGNLVGNAIKFTERGSVQVTSALDEDPARGLAIRIADTGVGIPADQFERIFDEFAQLRNPERDRGKGAGLGLAISRRLVTLLGGVIELESRPGEGATFTIRLPAPAISPRWTAGGDRLEQAALRPARSGPLDLDILLVEDHLHTREGIRRILEEEGARITEAEDGGTALDRLGEDRFDVILLDMMLPDIDGRDVLKALQPGRRKKLKEVLVLTADLTPERAEEVRKLGAHSLIAKPVDLNDLLERLRRLARKG
jgi:signal transduction histidine kinase